LLADEDAAEGNLGVERAGIIRLQCGDVRAEELAGTLIKRKGDG